MFIFVILFYFNVDLLKYFHFNTLRLFQFAFSTNEWIDRSWIYSIKLALQSVHILMRMYTVFKKLTQIFPSLKRSLERLPAIVYHTEERIVTYPTVNDIGANKEGIKETSYRPEIPNMRSEKVARKSRTELSRASNTARPCTCMIRFQSSEWTSSLSLGDNKGNAYSADGTRTRCRKY